MSKKKFSAEINHFIETRNTTCRGVGELLDLDHSTISQWCKGKSVPASWIIRTLIVGFLIGTLDSDIPQRDPKGRGRTSSAK